MDQSIEIKNFLKEELDIFDNYFRESVKSDNPQLTEMISYVFETNGKLLRPTLVLLTSKACGKITPETYHGATTVELLHTATLVHDDVIDRSNLRRGRPSVNAVYDNSRAVLVGDYLLSSALAESVKTKNLEIIEIISKLGKDLSEGELSQFVLAKEVIIDEKSYFNVIDKKTASLLRASLAIGAITGGAEREQITKLSYIGGMLGVCFQIRDDIFDYFDDNIGKPTGNDIREGKVTLPLIYAFKNAPEDLADKMLDIIKSGDFDDNNVKRLIDFAKEYRGIEGAYIKMDELLAEADKMLTDFSFDNEIKTYMRMFLTYLRNRSY